MNTSRLLTAAFMLMSGTAIAAPLEVGFKDMNNNGIRDTYGNYSKPDNTVGTALEKEYNQKIDDAQAQLNKKAQEVSQPEYVDYNNNGMRDTYSNYRTRDNSVSTAIEKAKNAEVDKNLSKTATNLSENTLEPGYKDYNNNGRKDTYANHSRPDNTVGTALEKENNNK